MNLLLGCIATDRAAATQLQEILARSDVAITLHSKPPQIDTSDAGDSAFHIVVLEHEHEHDIENYSSDVKPAMVSVARKALDWFISQNALRVLITHSPESSFSTKIANAIADDWLSYSSGDNMHWMAHWPMLPCPFAAPNETLEDMVEPEGAIQSDAEALYTLTIAADVIADGVQAIRTELAKLPPKQNSHVFFACDHHNTAGLLTVARGTEGARLLCGPPELACHLPALYRLRGWLTSAHQLGPLPQPTSNR